tara:strand:- start:682 stop:1248 length:567 start_codon:yes stop_codon:yes gene_type:complete
MKEKILREMIRKQIKSSLNEAPDLARSAVGASLGRVEKMAGVKMLKKALDQGSPQQQAAGLLKVVQTISGNNPTTAKMLARMLMKSGIEDTSTDTSMTEDSYTVGVDDGRAGTSIAHPGSDMAMEENKALADRMGRVDKTQAMKMLKQQLGTKPATTQSDFVLDLLNGLGLKDAAKQRLKMKIRQELK